MLALLLWYALGWRAAVVELLAELAICVAFLSGGGGGRLRRAFHAFAKPSLWPRRVTAAPGKS